MVAVGGTMRLSGPIVRPERAAILLVDDSRSDLMAMRNTLADLDVHIVAARSCEGARQKLSERAFALVVMKNELPHGSGMTVIRELREAGDNVTPVLFLTGRELTVEMVQQAYGLGAIDCFSKPISSTILQAKASVFCNLHTDSEALRCDQETMLMRAQQRVAELEQRLADGERTTKAKPEPADLPDLEARLAESKQVLSRGQQQLEVLRTQVSRLEAESGDDALQLSMEVTAIEVDVAEAQTQVDTLRAQIEAAQRAQGGAKTTGSFTFAGLGGEDADLKREVDRLKRAVAAERAAREAAQRELSEISRLGVDTASHLTEELSTAEVRHSDALDSASLELREARKELQASQMQHTGAMQIVRLELHQIQSKLEAEREKNAQTHGIAEQLQEVELEHEAALMAAQAQNEIMEQALSGMRSQLEAARAGSVAHNEAGAELVAAAEAAAEQERLRAVELATRLTEFERLLEVRSNERNHLHQSLTEVRGELDGARTELDQASDRVSKLESRLGIQKARRDMTTTQQFKIEELQHELKKALLTEEEARTTHDELEDVKTELELTEAARALLAADLERTRNDHMATLRAAAAARAQAERSLSGRIEALEAALLASEQSRQQTVTLLESARASSEQADRLRERLVLAEEAATDAEDLALALDASQDRYDRILGQLKATEAARDLAHQDLEQARGALRRARADARQIASQADQGIARAQKQLEAANAALTESEAAAERSLEQVAQLRERSLASEALAAKLSEAEVELDVLVEQLAAEQRAREDADAALYEAGQKHAEAHYTELSALRGHLDHALGMAQERQRDLEASLAGVEVEMRKERRQRLKTEEALARTGRELLGEKSRRIELEGSQTPPHRTGPSAATSERYRGQLSRAIPDRFDRWVGEYGRILDAYVSASIEDSVENEAIETLAFQLIDELARPADVVQLHAAALRARSHTVDMAVLSPIAIKTQMVLLRLMGQMAQRYRDGYRPLLSSHQLRAELSHSTIN